MIAPDFQDKIFLVDQGQIERFDVGNNKNTVKVNFKYNSEKLWEIATFQYWLWEIAQEVWNIPYIRITDIDEFGQLKKNNLKYIYEKDNFSNSILNKWDILVARTWATYWKTLYFNEDFRATFWWFLIRVNLNTEKILSKYYFYFSHLDLYWINAKKLVGWWGQPQFNANAVKELEIPIPPIEIQNQIVEKMDKAMEIKLQKEKEAKELLDSIDDYVLWELWIQYEEVEEKKVFTINVDDLGDTKRFDTFYNNPKFIIQEKQVKNWKYDLVKLWDKFQYINGFAFSSKDYENEWVKLLTIKNITKTWVRFDNTTYLPKDYINKFNSFKLQKNDILFAMTGATIWKACIFKMDEQVLLNQRCWAIRTNTENQIYLYTILNLKFYNNEIFRNSWGWAQPNISHNEILNIEIPLPPIEVQNKIADEVKTRIDKAELLKKEATNVYETAKIEVEKMLLGE